MGVDTFHFALPAFAGGSQSRHGSGVILANLSCNCELTPPQRRSFGTSSLRNLLHALWHAPLIARFPTGLAPEPISDGPAIRTIRATFMANLHFAHLLPPNIAPSAPHSVRFGGWSRTNHCNSVRLFYWTAAVWSTVVNRLPCYCHRLHLALPHILVPPVFDLVDPAHHLAVLGAGCRLHILQLLPTYLFLYLARPSSPAPRARCRRPATPPGAAATCAAYPCSGDVHSP